MSSTTAGVGLPGQGSSGQEQVINSSITRNTMFLHAYLLQSPPLVLSHERLLAVLEDLTQRITSLEKKLTSPGAAG